MCPLRTKVMSDARASVFTGGSSDKAAIAVVLPTPTGPVNMILFSFIIFNPYLPPDNFRINLWSNPRG